LNQTTCNTNTSCTWVASNFSCAGTATPCSQISVPNCTAQDGCSVQ